MIVRQGYDTGKTLYVVFRNDDGEAWDTTGTPAYETYATANLANYDVAAVEQGTASQIYECAVPAGVITANFTADWRVRIGGAPAESDPCIAIQAFYALDKTGYALAATGLDSITVPTLSAPATTFVGKVTQLWDRFFRKTVKDISSNTIKVYATNGTDVVTSQTIAETITTETQGEAS